MLSGCFDNLMQKNNIVHFCFVILHYGDAVDTMSAIGSVLAQKNGGHKVSVVVVDNASPNGTGIQVKKQVENLKDVYFIQNKENFGFARGNNVGFRFAKYELYADFIVLMNNDAVIESRNLAELVLYDYEKENFAVLGPSIRTPNGKQQNPLRINLLKELRLKLTVVYLYVDLLLTLSFISPIISRFFSKFISKIVLCSDPKPMNDVELHGSFLIFSPIYIARFDGLDEQTFLYCEEEFLFARCHFNKLKTRFNPQIQIIHNEVEANNSSIFKIRKKRLFRVRNCLKSLIIYRESLKKKLF